jgi:cytidine deaminase
MAVLSCYRENISFGLTMCAERLCVGRAIDLGEKDFATLAIFAHADTPIVPCGACRHVLAEFAPTLSIVSWTLAGVNPEFSPADLLPLPSQAILQVPRGT